MTTIGLLIAMSILTRQLAITIYYIYFLKLIIPAAEFGSIWLKHKGGHFIAMSIRDLCCINTQSLWEVYVMECSRSFNVNNLQWLWH